MTAEALHRHWRRQEQVRDFPTFYELLNKQVKFNSIYGVIVLGSLRLILINPAVRIIFTVSLIFPKHLPVPRSSTMSLSVRSPFSSHLETPEVSDLYKTQSTHFPSYLLQDVLTHLNVFDLLSCRRVCRPWYEVLQSRRLLREKLFLKQPDTNLAPFIKEPSERATFELHPIFSTIHFTSSLCAEDTTFGRKSSVFLKDSVVRNNYATSPVTTRISLGVLKFHPDCIVENPTGVTVWDVIMRLAE